jgi:hypothetical protein
VHFHFLAGGQWAARREDVAAIQELCSDPRFEPLLDPDGVPAEGRAVYLLERVVPIRAAAFRAMCAPPGDVQLSGGARLAGDGVPAGRPAAAAGPSDALMDGGAGIDVLPRTPMAARGSGGAGIGAPGDRVTPAAAAVRSPPSGRAAMRRAAVGPEGGSVEDLLARAKLAMERIRQRAGAGMPAGAAGAAGE